MNIDFHGLSLRRYVLPGFFSFPSTSFFFVSTDSTGSPAAAGLDPLGNVFELGIPVWVIDSLTSLAVRLKTEAGRLQQLSHLPMAHFKAVRLKRPSQGPSAFAGPPQRGHRISTGLRFHQLFESGHQSRLLLLARLPYHTPTRRWRFDGSGFGSWSSRIPLRTVRSEIPVATATAVIPPLPRDSASVAAQRRRPRSSKSWAILANFCRIHAMTCALPASTHRGQFIQTAAIPLSVA